MFALWPLDHYIYLPTLSLKSQKEVDDFYSCASDKIAQAIEGVKHKVGEGQFTDMAQKVVQFCKRMLEGVDDLHDEQGARKLFKNYIGLIPELDEMGPVVERVYKY